MQLDSELSFQYVLYSSYSWLKLDHTVADCIVFTWTLHQDLLFKWLDNLATKELELHLLGLELFWNTLLHFGKLRSSASGTLSIENLPSFALKDVLFFICI
uniref:Uncharacterized protein n=1 Tax=Cebus imitator TaxID=2715852 RepID=A0A2K5QL54_CEBIM